MKNGEKKSTKMRRNDNHWPTIQNEDALMEWVTCNPIIAATLRDLFDDDLNEDKNFRQHHENGDSFERRFLQLPY